MTIDVVCWSTRAWRNSSLILKFSSRDTCSLHWKGVLTDEKGKKGLVRPHRLLNRAYIAHACQPGGRMDGVVGSSADN